MTIHDNCWYCSLHNSCHAEGTECPVDSVVLKRLVQEVSRDQIEHVGYNRIYNRYMPGTGPYNRTYNRHNR
jgi:hypothetical protein